MSAWIFLLLTLSGATRTFGPFDTFQACVDAQVALQLPVGESADLRLRECEQWAW